VRDPASEARIRDLLGRIARNAASPLFVGLAEEYRAAGDLPEAIRTLEKGILSHPVYVAARVALGRAYLEAGRPEAAAEMFSRALALDPANMVSARSLAEIHLARGERIEAIKKFKLYRALSGDRAVGGIIGRLEAELGSAPRSAEPRGRVLADLYFEQGHYGEALAAYEELARADPSEAGLLRRKSEAAERLAAATSASPAVARPSGAKPTGARILALKRWLSVIQKR
jgi:tetratricopeptide (TPR) repeat protein